MDFASKFQKDFLLQDQYKGLEAHDMDESSSDKPDSSSSDQTRYFASPKAVFDSYGSEKVFETTSSTFPYPVHI